MYEFALSAMASTTSSTTSGLNQYWFCRNVFTMPSTSILRKVSIQRKKDTKRMGEGHRKKIEANKETSEEEPFMKGK